MKINKIICVICSIICFSSCSTDDDSAIVNREDATCENRVITGAVQVFIEI